jgi:hypothetical protein
MADEPSEVLDTFQFLSTNCGKIGFQLNTTESELAIIGGSSEEI